MSGPGDETRVFVTDTRRRWSLSEKRAIVAETQTNSVTRVARKHGVASGLLFRWRKTLAPQTAVSPPAGPAGKRLVPVVLSAPTVRQEALAGHGGDGAIEIVLTGGRRVIVGKNVDGAALRLVIRALEER